MADRVLVMHEGRIAARALARARPTRSPSCAPRPAQRRWPRERAPAERAPPPAAAATAEERALADRRVVRAREVSLIGVLALLVLGVCDRRAALPQRPEPARHPAQRHDHRAARGRPDDRRRHAQHRPLASARSSASPRSRPASCSPTTACRSPSCSSAGSLFGAFFGLMNGVMVALGAGAVAGDHARHAVRDPRDRLRVGARPADQRRRHARQLPGPGHGATSLGFPVLPLITIAVMILVGTVLGRARMGRELYAIGSNPDAARAGRHPRQPPRARRVRRLAARSPAWPACSTPPATARWTPPPGTGIELAAVSAVVVGGVAIFGGSGTVYGAALGALLLATIRSRAGDPAGQPVLGAGHQRRAAAARHRPRRLLAAAIGARTAQEGLAPCLTSRPRRRRRAVR